LHTHYNKQRVAEEELEVITEKLTALQPAHTLLQREQAALRSALQEQTEIAARWRDEAAAVTSAAKQQQQQQQQQLHGGSSDAGSTATAALLTPTGQGSPYGLRRSASAAANSGSSSALRVHSASMLVFPQATSSTAATANSSSMLREDSSFSAANSSNGDAPQDSRNGSFFPSSPSERGDSGGFISGNSGSVLLALAHQNRRRSDDRSRDAASIAQLEVRFTHKFVLVLFLCAGCILLAVALRRC
jgi:hypothetical protein